MFVFNMLYALPDLELCYISFTSFQSFSLTSGISPDLRSSHNKIKHLTHEIVVYYVGFIFVLALFNERTHLT